MSSAGRSTNAIPKEPEGYLSRRYNVLVARETCAEIGRELGIPSLVRLGKQARDDGASQSDNVIGDVVEALIGALCLDGGLEAAEHFTARVWEPQLAEQRKAPKHPKSALQELAAEKELQAARVRGRGRTGAHHAPKFTIQRIGPGTWRGDRGRNEQAGSRNRGGGSAVEQVAMSQAPTRAGFVAVIGAPNAGKSTLVNALVGQKVAIVSPKAQTTRARLMEIALHEGAQILLVDTPGIFEPKRRLDRAMVAAAWTGAQDADLILLVIDAAAGVIRRSNASSPRSASGSSRCSSPSTRSIS